MESKLRIYENQLSYLGERSSPEYAEENFKTELRAKITLIKELLCFDHDEQHSEKLYRVELVDFINAKSEHEAIDIFIQVIPEVDVSDDSFDVYEVDPKTRKAVK
jgi:hypothetical protein